MYACGGESMMYKTECSYCGKPMYTYAKNRLGELPVVFCSKKCRGDYKEKDKFVKNVWK